MNIKAKKYWTSLTSDKKQALADRCGIKKNHLSMLFNGQVVGYEMAKTIASKTGGALKPSDVRKPPY